MVSACTSDFVPTVRLQAEFQPIYTGSLVALPFIALLTFCRAANYLLIVVTLGLQFAYLLSYIVGQTGQPSADLPQFRLRLQADNKCTGYSARAYVFALPFLLRLCVCAMHLYLSACPSLCFVYECVSLDPIR